MGRRRDGTVAIGQLTGGTWEYNIISYAFTILETIEIFSLADS